MNVLAEAIRRFTVRRHEVAQESVAKLHDAQTYAMLVGTHEGLLEAERIIEEYLEEQQREDKQ